MLHDARIFYFLPSPGGDTLSHLCSNGLLSLFALLCSSLSYCWPRAFSVPSFLFCFRFLCRWKNVLSLGLQRKALVSLLRDGAAYWASDSHLLELWQRHEWFSSLAREERSSSLVVLSSSCTFCSCQRTQITSVAWVNISQFFELTREKGSTYLCIFFKLTVSLTSADELVCLKTWERWTTVCLCRYRVGSPSFWYLF